ncbi:MAG: very short patch repair endonuclease [Planctomycetota bacterium]
MHQETAAQRSRVMAAVKSRDTGPELLVAKLLRQAGIRFRRDVSRLPGRPDFLLHRAGAVLFVHGCWWHGHDCRRGQRTPKTNREYWQAKIARNRRRDRRVARELRARGYAVWTVWECSLKSGRLPTRLLRAAQRLQAR